MPDADDLLRRLFASWIRGHVAAAHLSEDDISRQLGLPDHWLDALERGDPSRDLTWIQGWTLIELLGGDPNAVGTLLLDALRLAPVSQTRKLPAGARRVAGTERRDDSRRRMRATGCPAATSRLHRLSLRLPATRLGRLSSGPRAQVRA